MTINADGTYVVPTFPVCQDPDNLELPPMVVPDHQGIWAIRYLWIRHRTKNDEFIANYFNKGNNATGTGLNVRKQTAHLQDAWKPHNDIFNESAANGDLVWRVKVLNTFAQSIDYVEIWKSRAVLRRLWIPKSDANPDGVRTQEDIDALRQGVYDAGFEVRAWVDQFSGWPTVTKLRAMGWYKHFIDKWKAQDNCIINTPWNKNLNPLFAQNQQF